jgi:hypothetical protein
MMKNGSRVAMGLMCALAMCCAVMYITADGADVQETVLAPAKSVYGIGGPASVDSQDVEKAGTVVTNTPDGRMRLTDYLANVEKEIAAEEAARKRDVLAVQQQMARNFAFNKAARAKLQKAMLAKMAANAKKAKDDLARSMKFVQAKFAAAAALQNKRNKANIRRSRKLRKRIARNKALAAKNLAHQVLVQQRALAAVGAAANSRIDQTNKHVAANAAQIKTNAKKAADDLAHAMNKYDQKVANARAEAAAGRGKLATQLANQDKSIRQWANNKLKIVMSKTAAQFRRVREKMAEDRHHADMALKAASNRMTASMNAFTALNNKRFQKTVSDIAAAKKEAKDRLDKAETSFKVGLRSLTSTVQEQVQKTNARIEQVSNTVDKNKVAQAKINANVNAEAKRMVALGNKRYNEHLKKDKELKNLIDSNKAATDKRLQAMSAHFTMELNAVKATMKKNRAHASHMLAKKSAELYTQIEKDERAQLDTNGKLKEQTREATMAIQASLKDAKDDFAKRLTALHTTVVKNDKKFEGKMDKLTGIVRANEVKNQKGRDQLASIMKANKAELKTAVRDAIHKGETRMAKAEKHLTDLNEKTKATLNMKITTAIAAQAKRANDQIEGLRLSSKEARAEMKKQLLYAIRSMSQEAKENLDAAKEVAVHVFTAVNAKEAAAAKHSAADRAKIAESIKEEKEATNRQVKDAVASMHRSLLALKYETEAKIKKTNTKVDAYAAALKKEAQDVAALMSSQMSSLHSKIAAQKSQATGAIKGADAASAAGFAAAMDEVEASLKAAEEDANAKFTGLEEDMADQRSHLVKELGSAVADINDKIAKQAALADSRFSKTVKDISAARHEAATEVAEARQEFATDLAAVTSTIKEMDTRLTGEVQVVSGSVIEFKAQQHIVNRHVNAEINRVEKLMDARASHSKRARGKLRAILDENKRAAHEEVVALDGIFRKKIAKIRSESADDAHSARADLATATSEMYEKMADAQTEMIYANEGAASAINKYSKESLAAIAASKANFEDRLDVLTNTIAANNRQVEKGFEVLTGVVRDHKAAGEKDRALIKKQNAAMAADMDKKIVNAIQKGEAEAKAVAQQARSHLAAEKKSMLVEITNTVEDYADMIFSTVQGKHQKLADNYLSLKAYAAAAEPAIEAYVAKGKGKNLSSLGDLLTNIAGLAKVDPPKAEGLSPNTAIPSIFSGMRKGGVKVDNKVTKINGLVHEYVEVTNGVRARWPMGLGKYLLMKLEGSMSKKGVLQVDKISGKSGNFVYINGNAVGLSNKLNDFESLAVRMAKYEGTLAKLTAALSGKHKPGPPVPKPVYANPPEYEGD